ncbi:glycosyltransferase [uncultured Marivirga sp.]|uniref:glycosyltransferase n=1 Tax=uncultured Marivirga sp. TaxID=1123707 RepID=UPI0030EB3634|tara:strand:+ start:41685 stop:42878 length:1194 start_codon:yes stop_codon:yes gene_type:complete
MKSALVFIYNSFNDPLFKGNLFQHLLKESKNSRFKFIIISFEQPDYQLSVAERERIKKELLGLNIYWYPLKWHSGRLILLKKLYDGIIALLLVLKLHFRFKPKVIISLGTIAGSFAYILKKVLALKHFAYQHEPHSEFMLDFGIWKKSSISYRLLNYFERKTAKSAEIISTGTDFMLHRLKRESVTGEVYKLPSCANDKIFIIDHNKRLEVRHSLGLSKEHNVFIYVGKFGGIYYKEEIFEVIGELNRLINDFFIIILSPNERSWIEEMLVNENVTQYYVSKVPYEKVYEYLNASDMGISAIPGFPSQKYRSPIKVGEYLLCGLPYITNKGVSEDDIIAKKFKAGVVLNEFSKNQVNEQIDSIKSLCNRNINLRKIGLNYRGISVYKSVTDNVFSKL